MLNADAQYPLQLENILFCGFLIIELRLYIDSILFQKVRFHSSIGYHKRHCQKKHFGK